MVKKVSLLGLIGLLLVVGTSGYAEVKPTWEIGDAVFRPLRLPLVGGFGHTGIYCCSQSDNNKVSIGTESPYPIQITDSDLKHSMIQGNEKEPPPPYKPVDFVPLEYVLHGMMPYGAYNNGGLSAYQRRKIVATAYLQAVKGDCVYEEKNPNRIKYPATNENGWRGSFRCDGFVEYCYEQVKPGGFFTDSDEKECWSKLLDLKYAYGIWPKFYPTALMKKMKKAEANLPEIKKTELYKDGKPLLEIFPWSKVTGAIEIKVKVMDGASGSGIDRVEFYYTDQILINLIDKKDEDKDDEGIMEEYSCNWDVSSISQYPMWRAYARVYDRAGNMSEGEKFVIGNSYDITDGFFVIIDHTPPQVASTTPSNGDTKIYLGKKIRVTFSEEMATETINSDTILVNNGAIVGSVTYAEDLRTAFFVPDEALETV
ncbi:MAG: Ig-like domain-containing protein [bacterium]